MLCKKQLCSINKYTFLKISQIVKTDITEQNYKRSSGYIRSIVDSLRGKEALGYQWKNKQYNRYITSATRKQINSYMNMH